MIRSMTAFARVETQAKWGNAQIEMKSVNQRFLETNFRLPETFRYLEGKLRENLRQALSRGKVDCQIKFDLSEQTAPSIKINHNLASQLADNIAEVQKITDSQGNLDLIRFLQWPDMVSVEKADLTEVEKALLSLFNDAIQLLIETREREGKNLKALIETRLKGISQQVATVRAQMPEILSWQKERLLLKFADANINPDNERLEQELVLLAQKVDVAEELDRLDTHIIEFHRILDSGGAVGRRMDFLLQEFNREANTLGSKSINKDVTAASVELKVLIEQIREQIQNIE